MIEKRTCEHKNIITMWNISKMTFDEIDLDLQLRFIDRRVVPPRPCSPSVQCPSASCLRSVPVSWTLSLVTARVHVGDCALWWPPSAKGLKRNTLIERDVQTEGSPTVYRSPSSYLHRLLSIVVGEVMDGARDVCCASCRRVQEGACRHMLIESYRQEVDIEWQVTNSSISNMSNCARDSDHLPHCTGTA